jgi:hypothetical protein
VRRDLIASLRRFTPPSVIFSQLEEERNRILYSNIDLPCKVEADGVECRKRLDCFTQVIYAFLSNVGASKKKREVD